jgi:hypothetical protein
MALPLTNTDAICLRINEFKDIKKISKMSCAICLVKDKHHDMFSDVKRCVSGTMRCEEHTMQCANCCQSVDSDAQLICSSCFQTGHGTIFNEILFSSPTQKPCLFATFKDNVSLACGCAKCMSETAEFYSIRAIEEGYASSLSSPTLSDDDASGIRMAF